MQVRTLGKVISRLKSIKEFGCKTFEKLYDSCVIPLMDYGSGVWGKNVFLCIDSVQQRAMRYHLGVHRFAPILAITGDMGWLPAMYRRWINMIRYWNRLILLNDDRITTLCSTWIKVTVTITGAVMSKIF